MRLWLICFALILTPAAALAQLARPDSAGVATAIARVLRDPIQKNGSPRAAPVVSKTITPESVGWNARLVNALKALDTALIARRPSKETLLFNIVSLSMTKDTASANIAMSRCYNDRFVGSSAIYDFKRQGNAWVVVKEQRGLAARGKCPIK